MGNKGFRRYLKIDKGAARINEAKVEAEARYDGKWVLRTNTGLSAEQVALKYKQLWQVGRVFRDVKSLLPTRPIFISATAPSGAMCFAASSHWC